MSFLFTSVRLNVYPLIIQQITFEVVPLRLQQMLVSPLIVFLLVSAAHEQQKAQG